MSSPPWMKFYVGDFIADTMHLNDAETGIYIRLLLHCWQHHTIPDDDRQLAMIGHCELRHWHHRKKKIIAFFQPAGAGLMQHVRVGRELRLAMQKSNNLRAAAVQMHINRGAVDLRLREVRKKEKKDSPSPASPLSAVAPQQERRATEPEIAESAPAPRPAPPPVEPPANKPPNAMTRAEYDEMLAAKRAAKPEPEAPRRKITMAEYAEIMRARAHG